MNDDLRQKLQEVIIFGMVGVAASVTHFIVAVVLIEMVSLSIPIANVLAFLSALPVSYFGHAILTFSAQRYGRETEVTKQSAARFVTLSVIGFCINQASVVYFAAYLGYPHRIVLVVTILGVAGFLFLASMFWAFRGKDGTS